MEAPNKIYTDGKSTYATLPVFSNTDSNIVYISKNALLQWAKTKLSHLQEDFDVYTGQRLILHELIEKIESL